MENTVWAKARYQYRSDTSENWENANPILLAGEHGVVIDSDVPYQREKIGDGKTPWNDLGWYHGPQGAKGDKGDKGDPGPQGIQGIKGDSYVLTDTDKQEISNEAIDSINNSWQRITPKDKLIVTEAETNGIMASVEEFPDIANCKEFIIRVRFPKNTISTDEKVSLGASRVSIGDDIGFFQTYTYSHRDFIYETRCHIIIADGLIFSTGTRNTVAEATVIENAGVLVGERFANETNKDIMYYLTDSTKYLPVGTQLIIYGKKVEIGESVEEIINDKLSDIETLLGGI